MAKNDPKHDFKFEVLQEQVATEDLFEEKTHERVATTLDELIRSTKQGLTIGLEGGWGSGKSTVINLLKEKLSGKNDKTLFFVFDAWAHDGDPLRKIFLESLITSINPKKNDKKLNDLKEKVSARTKTVNVRTEKSASRLGKIISWTALLIPVGAALLSAVDYNNLLMPWHNQASTANLAFLFGILFSFSPLAVLAWWAKWGVRDSETNKVKWDIFQSDSTENYTQDITEDGERTSIEFEKFFKDILCYVFESSSQYEFERAIIVVDNLDRVEAEYAQNVWSTLQTFFQHRTSSLNGFDEKWNQQLWFLIPHDREGIQRIWHNPNTGDESVNQEISSSFMEKCFQVNVEVPPPVMSTWIEYFKQCVQKSLTGWSENYKDEYINSYIQCMSRLDTSPSPRQIHTHINRAGVLALQWKDEFSAEAYCLYSLCRKCMSESEFRQQLLNDGVPSSYPTIRSANKVKAELAGLLFGVKAEKGMQLLLSPEIRECMQEGNGEKLQNLSEVHKEAFWVVLRASKNNWLPTIDHVDDYKLCVIEAIYKGFANDKNMITEFVSTIQAVMVSTIDRWKLDEYSFAEDIKYLVELSENKDQLLNDLEQGIRKRIVACTKDEKFKSEELTSLKELEELLYELGKPLVRKHYPSLDYKKWQTWLQATSAKGVYFTSILPKKDVFEQLVNNAGFNQTHLNEPVFKALTETFKIYSEQNVWKNLVEKLISWFNIQNRDYECNDVYDLAIEVIAATSNDEKQKLKSTVSEAPFWQAAVHSQPKTNPSLPILVAMSDPKFRENSNISSNIGSYFDSLVEPKALEAVYSRFKNAKELWAIWSLAKSDANEFARQIIRSSEQPELFEIGASIVDEISWKDDKEAKLIVEKLSLNGAFTSVVASAEKDPCLYGDNLYMFNKYGDENIQREITDILEKTTREQWIKALSEDSKLLKLIPTNSSNFAKAWCEYIINIIKDEEEEPSTESLNYIVELKDRVVDLEKLYIPQLTKAFFESTDNISDKAFNALSSLFNIGIRATEQQSLEQRVSDWIEYQKLERLNWLLNSNIEFKETPSQTLIADVTTKIKHAESEELNLYQSLNEKLGLNIQIEEVEPEGNTGE